MLDNNVHGISWFFFKQITDYNFYDNYIMKSLEIKIIYIITMSDHGIWTRS